MFSYGWPPDPPEPQDFPCERCGKIESEAYGHWYTDNAYEYIFCCSKECLDSLLASFKRVLKRWTVISPVDSYDDPFSHI